MLLGINGLHPTTPQSKETYSLSKSRSMLIA